MSKIEDESKGHIPGNTQLGMAKAPVIVLSAEGKPTAKIHKTRVVIGSVISADVRLTDPGVAPIHAVIEIGMDLVKGGITPQIFDLASETGVFVNGNRAVTSQIKSGDLIRIGASTLRFSLEDPHSPSSQDRVQETGGRKLFQNPAEDLVPLLLQGPEGVEEIFDYRPASQQALEVVMSWYGTILDVEHFVREKAVTIGGGKKSDFAIPPFLSARSFDLVSRTGDDYVLNLEPGMEGVIQQGGSLRSLADLRASRLGGNGALVLPFKRGDFAKISLQKIDFYLSFTAAPPRLKRGRLFEKDPLLLQIVGSSLILTALTLFALVKAHVPQPVEAEQLPERIATILYQPEKYHVSRPKVEVPVEIKTPTLPKEVKVTQVRPPEPKPQVTTKIEIKPDPKNAHRPVPKEMDAGTKIAKNGSNKSQTQSPSKGQHEAKEGPGAKAKGKEGTRGTKNAKPDPLHQSLAKRPSPNGGKGNGSGSSQVQDQGNVDILLGASSRLQNLLGNSAQALGKGGEKLQGFGAFNTAGGGGLALSGDGKGGGGNAASLGGFSDHGTGGGRVGTGKGAAGSGSGIIGGQARVAIRSGGPEEAVVMGAIDAGAVEAALLAHKDELRLCYEKEINAQNPYIAGRVSTNFLIGQSGRVSKAGIDSSSLKNPIIERCILNVIKRIDFPIPRGGGVVQVAYPFKFSSSGK